MHVLMLAAVFEQNALAACGVCAALADVCCLSWSSDRIDGALWVRGECNFTTNIIAWGPRREGRKISCADKGPRPQQQCQEEKEGFVCVNRVSKLHLSMALLRAERTSLPLSGGYGGFQNAPRFPLCLPPSRPYTQLAATACVRECVCVNAQKEISFLLLTKKRGPSLCSALIVDVVMTQRNLA